MEDLFELEIESKLENLAVIGDFITDSIRELGLADRKIGELGVYFMKTLVDEVKYEFKDGKNVLTMVVRKV